MTENKEPIVDLVEHVTSRLRTCKECMVMKDDIGGNLKAIADAKELLVDLDNFEKNHENELSERASVRFWMHFARMHVLSAIAKWSEDCDHAGNDWEFAGDAEKFHTLCIGLIDDTLLGRDWSQRKCDGVLEDLQLTQGLARVRDMMVYELTRYAIHCSEKDDQDRAFCVLKRAESFFHKECSGKSEETQSNAKLDNCVPILQMLDSLTSDTTPRDMFTYVLFYIGQAYRIRGDKEKAVLYLHMVLRKQLETNSTHINNLTTWAADTARMGSVLISNMHAFDVAAKLLNAAMRVLLRVAERDKSTDQFKQNWADVGRTWIKFGVQLLEMSYDRLKDLDEQESDSLQHKFKSKIELTNDEKLSLGVVEEGNSFDTIHLINSLQFPEIGEQNEEEFKKIVQEYQIRSGFVRDFSEARAVFLPLQKWVTVAKSYYVFDSFASDYVDVMTDYSSAFKLIAIFEPNLQRQIKMHKRRIGIIEELVEGLNPTAFFDVVHFLRRELADVYEVVYKLKVREIREERGEPLRPKDKKLVAVLLKAVEAHKANLAQCLFDIKDTTKDLNPSEYEKTLLGSIITAGRLLASVLHQHPLHPDAITFAQEAKLLYLYLVEYLNGRPALKQECITLFDSSVDVPNLIEDQIQKIKTKLAQLGIGISSSSV